MLICMKIRISKSVDEDMDDNMDENEDENIDEDMNKLMLQRKSSDEGELSTAG